MRKHETITRDNGTIDVYGSNRSILIDDHVTPDWASEPEPSFRYRNRRYFLSEFMYTGDMPAFTDYAGYSSELWFSGVLLKYGTVDDADDMDHVRAFTYCS